MSVKISRPLMRAPFFDTSDDAAIWRWPYEYFLGDDLRVAPITEPGAESWQVYVPHGKWVDAWTGDQLSGPLLLERPTPLQEIPVYARTSRAPDLVPLFRP